MKTRLFFEVTSAAYDFLTNQSLWWEQIASVRDHVPDPESVQRILDIGCGPGSSAFVLAQRFPEAEVVGVDFSRRMIARARRHHGRLFPELRNVRFEVGDATDLRFDAGEFDLVVGHSFLYLVPQRQRVLEELRRVLGQGGRLVLLEPNRRGDLLAANRRRYGRDYARAGRIEVARFQASMVAWRFVSGNVGRLDAGEVHRWLLEAGFDDAAVVDTLGGLGMHCIGVVG